MPKDFGKSGRSADSSGSKGEGRKSVSLKASAKNAARKAKGIVSTDEGGDHHKRDALKTMGRRAKETMVDLSSRGQSSAAHVGNAELYLESTTAPRGGDTSVSTDIAFGYDTARDEHSQKWIESARRRVRGTPRDATNGERLALSEELVSRLQEINERNQGGIQILQHRLDEMTKERDEAIGRSERVMRENVAMKLTDLASRKKLEQLEKLNCELAGRVTEKAQAQAEDWRGRNEELKKANDELTSKIVNLARITEENNDEIEKTIDQLTRENKELLSFKNSMADAMLMANGMAEKMSSFSQAHEATVKAYEERLEGLKDELNSAQESKDEMLNELDVLKDKIRGMSTELEGAKAAKGHCMEQLVKCYAERDAARDELRELSGMHEILQQEMETACHILEGSSDGWGRATEEQEQVGSPREKEANAARMARFVKLAKLMREDDDISEGQHVEGVKS